MSSIEIKSSLIENQFQLNFQVIIFKKKQIILSKVKR